jgi:D-alanyl-lipoteichoic acid acyltransferase DltB (MBOAT superfamily)
MPFTSSSFLLFFIVFFTLYWGAFKGNVKGQNTLILIASYIFMAWMDVRFLFVLIGSSVVNYVLGIYIANAEEDENRQRLLLRLGLVIGVGSLLFFKSFNFFIDEVVNGFAKINIHFNIHTLHIILPLGISFYTFRSMSYLMDVESGKIKAVKDWLIFFSYMAFFPSSVSGPIDKARDLVPQLEKKRVFDSTQVIDGLRHILWGLFKKIVIADNITSITTLVFDHSHLYPGSTLLLCAFLYTIELYADFSGYSDMAVGIARLMGFQIVNNFKLPFFSQNIAEFWQKWHISLTAWMTEYVFTPLSFIFRTYGKAGTIIAILINFIVVGLWHKISWTYVVYGFLHGCYFIPLLLKGTVNANKMVAQDSALPNFREFMNMAGTFTLIMLTLILFNADSISEALAYYQHLFSASLFSPLVMPEGVKGMKIILIMVFIFGMFTIEWIGRQKPHPFTSFGQNWYVPVRWTMYYILIFCIFYFFNREQTFVYFQF